MPDSIHISARIRIISQLTLLLFIGCNSLPGQEPFDLGKVIYKAEDRSEVEAVLSLFTGNKEASNASLMVAVGNQFLGTPYVAHTLESEKELLVINVREVDCTTFAEYCLALARITHDPHPSFQKFAAELQRIRYRDGVIEGYPSRLHYFCDWIYSNEQKGLIKDMSEELAQTPLNKTIDFMSTHPDNYMQLKEDPALVEKIARQEREISKRELFYVPESRVAELEYQFMEGDIVGITTEVKGLAISHVGILVKKAGRIHLLHASSAAGKVVVSDNTLEAYLLNSKSATGIMVARPL